MKPDVDVRPSEAGRRMDVGIPLLGSRQRLPSTMSNVVPGATVMLAPIAVQIGSCSAPL